MKSYSLLSFAILAANAIELGYELPTDTCANNLAFWLPEGTDTGVSNPEDAGRCTRADAANGFADCMCVPAGLINWDRDDDYKTDMGPLGVTSLTNSGLVNSRWHLVMNSREFQALDHQTKMDMLWDQLTKVRKVKCQDWDDLWKNFHQNPLNSIKKPEDSDVRLSRRYKRRQLKREQEQVGWGDEMGKERILDRTKPRKKLVHQQGVVTKARFVVTNNNQDYTGIFEGGADNVLIRFSESQQHLAGVTNSVSPSFALKFLRTGVVSANAFAQVAFDHPPEEASFDFWRDDFLSHIPNFRNSEQQLE